MHEVRNGSGLPVRPEVESGPYHPQRFRYPLSVGIEGGSDPDRSASLLLLRNEIAGRMLVRQDDAFFRSHTDVAVHDATRLVHVGAGRQVPRLAAIDVMTPRACQIDSMIFGRVHVHRHLQSKWQFVKPGMFIGCGIAPKNHEIDR